MTDSHLDIRPHKNALRREAELRRAQAHPKSAEAALALRDNILKDIAFSKSSTIAFYYPRGSEIDPLPLMQALQDLGHTLALPVIVGRQEPLVFRAYRMGDALTPAMFGTQEPPPTAPSVEPTTLFVPLLGFDKNKGRLGYGGGYYDRTINILRQHTQIRTIGLAYSAQELPDIPMGIYDARLDKIATEHQVF